MSCPSGSIETGRCPSGSIKTVKCPTDSDHIEVIKGHYNEKTHQSMKLAFFGSKKFFEKNAVITGEISFFDFGEDMIGKFVSIDCHFCKGETSFLKLEPIEKEESWYATFTCNECSNRTKFYVDVDIFMEKLVKELSEQNESADDVLMGKLPKNTNKND